MSKLIDHVTITTNTEVWTIHYRTGHRVVTAVQGVSLADYGPLCHGPVVAPQDTPVAVAAEVSRLGYKL